MDGQVTARTLVCAIANRSTGGWLINRLAELRERLAEVAGGYRKPEMGPQDAQQFEHCVEMIVREQALSFIECCFNSLESENVDAMPRDIEFGATPGDYYHAFSECRTPTHLASPLSKR